MGQIIYNEYVTRMCKRLEYCINISTYHISYEVNFPVFEVQSADGDG